MSSKKNRDINRQNEFRAGKSEQFTSSATDAIYKKLCFGFTSYAEAMANIQIVATPETVMLPITTRAIGFIVRFLLYKFASLNINGMNFHQTCGAIYRVYMAAVEMKIATAMKHQTSINMDLENFVMLNCGVDMLSVLSTLGSGFAPLSNVVSSIGVLKAFGTVYLPRLPRMLTQEGQTIWDPSLLSLCNLRRAVVAMSNPVTPLAIRQAFYSSSPIPNAIWHLGEDGNDPILANPDDVMPEEYNADDLQADVMITMTALERIGKKYPKYVHPGAIDYNASGNYSQLVSSKKQNLHCEGVTYDGMNVNYTMLNIRGKVDEFWSPELLPQPEFYIGMLHLTGENCGLDERFGLRQESVRKQRASGSFLSCLSNLVG